MSMIGRSFPPSAHASPVETLTSAVVKAVVALIAALAYCALAVMVGGASS